MDGLPQSLVLDASSSGLRAPSQTTLKSAIDCVGIGVHSGMRVRLVMRPAPAGHGIVFHRTDLNRSIPARFDHVLDARLCTVLGDPHDPTVRVGTVEHLMAALSGRGIDNALIELDGPEVPIFDGSAAPILFLLDCAGVVTLPESRSVIEIVRPVRVSDGPAFAELRPCKDGEPGLEMTFSIDFAASAIGRQSYHLDLTPEGFRHELSRARTFAIASEVAELRAKGLALGGSLDNALVVDGPDVLNPGGLRMPEEFVRHKLLDAVGDLALAGAPIHGRFVAHRSGHSLNNRLLRAVFADSSAWRFRLAGRAVDVAA